MLNIGPLELMLIAVVALVVVGPRRLPEIGRQAGKLIRDLRRMQDEVKDTIRFDLDDEPEEEDDDEPPTARVRSSAREHRAHTSRVARDADDVDADDEPPPQRTRPTSASDSARAQARAKERQAAAGQTGGDGGTADDGIEDRDGREDRSGRDRSPEEPVHSVSDERGPAPREEPGDGSQGDPLEEPRTEPREEPRAAEGS
jgi:Tat protein translocase TatB subunit